MTTTDKPTEPQEPAGLHPRAAELWRDALATYVDWTPTDLELLGQLCATVTRLESLEAALEGADLLARGSHGGVIAHPLLAEARMTRNTVLSILRALNLPQLEEEDDEDDEVSEDGIIIPMSRSEVARKAANARWGGRNA